MVMQAIPPSMLLLPSLFWPLASQTGPETAQVLGGEESGSNRD